MSSSFPLFSILVWQDELMLICERLLLNLESQWDSWPPEEKNSIQGQGRGLIAQSFCAIEFY